MGAEREACRIDVRGSLARLDVCLVFIFNL
jgi:hypothetical protein